MALIERCRNFSSASPTSVISSLPVTGTVYSRSPAPMRRIQISMCTVLIPR